MMVHTCVVDDGTGNKINLLDSNGYYNLFNVNKYQTLFIVLYIRISTVVLRTDTFWVI